MYQFGHAIWATNAPQAIFSFLTEYDLSGKRIIPFCTHDGYGAGSSYADIAEAIPRAKEVLEGLAIEAPDVPEAENVVAGWLQDIGVSRQAESSEQVDGTPITITIGDAVLNGVLYDTALAGEIRAYFPLTVQSGLPLYLPVPLLWHLLSIEFSRFLLSDSLHILLPAR